MMRRIPREALSDAGCRRCRGNPSGRHPPLRGLAVEPFVDVAAFGIAILAAGFLLSWGAETAEQYVSQGLILAAVALVTVLPEYAVDIYYAYMAGASGPDSRYAQYAAANMTGANRLLVGLAGR
ncbi:hypothetical protein [Methylobacterium tardum]|uniref:hypothetical protein n=1 Tax=Methylobacterium tardum TaxID=374432 RepID=UPI00360661E8